MLKKAVVVLAGLALLSAGGAAQTKPPADPPVVSGTQVTPSPQPPAPARPQPAGRQENIKLDLTITDQTGPGEPTKKTVTMIVADRERGSIRSRGRVMLSGNRWQDLTINVDAVPWIVRDGNAVRVQLGLEYQPRTPGAAAPANAKEVEAATELLLPIEPIGNLNEQITLILEPGKPLAISQAADPASDRRITVELRATILK